jgi:hypothetical protein
MKAFVLLLAAAAAASGQDLRDYLRLANHQLQR